jgi:hypothetical protein
LQIPSDGAYQKLTFFIFFIKAKDLIEAVAKAKSNVGSDTDSDTDEKFVKKTKSDQSLTDDMKIHRILLLRSWLFHFVGSVHSYFMTRVVHSTEIELKSELANCTDLVKAYFECAFSELVLISESKLV